MTDDSPNLPFDVQQRLDEHLDKVDDVLKRYGKSRTDRSAIVDGLADQIHEMLRTEAEASEAQTPTRDQLETVLSKIDPPEAYARHSIDLAQEPTLPAFAYEGMAAPASRFNKATMFGLIWLVWLFLSIGVLAVLAETRVGHNGFTYARAYQTWWGILLLLFVGLPGLLAPIGTTILGWVGISQIKHSRGQQHGLGLAVFNALAFVLIVVVAGIWSVALTPSMAGFVFLMRPQVEEHQKLSATSEIKTALSAVETHDEHSRAVPNADSASLDQERDADASDTERPTTAAEGHGSGESTMVTARTSIILSLGLIAVTLVLGVIALVVSFFICRRIIRVTWQKANEPVGVAGVS